MSGNIKSGEDQGVEGVIIKSNITEVKTDESGTFLLEGLTRGENLKIIVSDSFEKPVFDIDYNASTRKGIKKYYLQKNLTLNQSAIGFTEEVYTNIKFSKHNILWNNLDEPSKKIYENVDAYEDFFKAVLSYTRERAMRDFSIDKNHITLRPNWTSPQKVKYQDVYEIPIQETLNDGTTKSSSFYIFKINDKWKFSTFTATKEEYDKRKKFLKENNWLE